jgi:hypothetical protein
MVYNKTMKNWAFVLPFLIVLLIAYVSPYGAKYEDEDFGFSHAGAILTIGYATANGRWGIVFMMSISVATSVMWHASVDGMHFADRFAVAALMLYTVGSPAIEAIEDKDANIAAYRVVGVAAAYAYSWTIVKTLDVEIEEYVLMGSVCLVAVAMVAVATFARTYSHFWKIDVAGTVVAGAVATWWYRWEGSIKGHAMWHVFGSLSIAFAVTLSKSSCFHGLGLYQTPPTCNRSTVVVLTHHHPHKLPGNVPVGKAVRRERRLWV